MSCCFCYFFFNDTATTEIYTLSLHDALPISDCSGGQTEVGMVLRSGGRRLYICARRQRIFVTLWGKIFRRIRGEISSLELDRKSTRLNSSHLVISYAVFCLKKKKSSSVYRRC